MIFKKYNYSLNTTLCPPPDTTTLDCSIRWPHVLRTVRVTMNRCFIQGLNNKEKKFQQSFKKINTSPQLPFRTKMDV